MRRKNYSDVFLINCQHCYRLICLLSDYSWNWIRKPDFFPPSYRMLGFISVMREPTFFLRNRKSPTKTMARRTPLKTSRKIRSPSFVEHSITLKTSRHIQVTEYSINYYFATEKKLFFIGIWAKCFLIAHQNLNQFYIFVTFWRTCHQSCSKG